MSFEKLLGELEELQQLRKSAPAEEDNAGAVDGDDAGIADAAAEGEGSEEEDMGADGHAEPDADDAGGAPDGDADDDVMGKSFRFTLENGEEVEAVDGTEMIKSLLQRFDTTEESMTKALGVAVDLIKSQGEAIEALQADVKRLSGEGRGRKTVVNVAERVPAAAPLQKSEPEGMKADEFMAKALTAQKEGRLTALDVAKAEGYLLKGLAVPADIIKRAIA